MPTLSIQSFDTALKVFMARDPVASEMSAAEWDQVNPEIRQHSFWSARQMDLDMLKKMKELIAEAQRVEDSPDKATMDRSKFVADMRAWMGSPEGDSGDLTDISSRKRLELIFDFNRTQANEFGRAIMGNTPAILRAFPCQELVRIAARRVPRDWQSIWVENGGTLYAGRMIATKDDPIWIAISRFGVPYPPFDYSSGMGVRDIGRGEAIRLGAIEPDRTVKRPKLTFSIDEEAA